MRLMQTRHLKLTISAPAWYKMVALVNENDKEVGWHGYIETDKDHPNEYRLVDIVVFPQYVTAATVEPEDAEYAQWLDEIAEQPNFNNLRFHGHSHVRMAPSPSGTDDAYRASLVSQIKADYENPFYIFMIINKDLKYTLEIYDVKEGIIYDQNDVDLVIEDWTQMVIINDWAKQVTKKEVKTKEYHYVCSTTSKALNSSIQNKSKKKKYTSSEQALSERVSQSYLRDWDYDE